jgi:hypothetical protein
MLENYSTVLYVLCFVVPVEYAAIAFASLVSKIVLVNFLTDLNETSRSKETKVECQKMKTNVTARYRESLLWPLEIWNAFRKK